MSLRTDGGELLNHDSARTCTLDRMISFSLKGRCHNHETAWDWHKHIKDFYRRNKSLIKVIIKIHLQCVSPDR